MERLVLIHQENRVRVVVVIVQQIQQAEVVEEENLAVEVRGVLDQVLAGIHLIWGNLVI